MSALRVRAVVVAALVGALVGCSEGEVAPEDTTAASDGANSEGPGGGGGGGTAYDGAYDSSFYDSLADYEGQEVTVVGEVGEVVSPTAFTIEGTEDTQVGPMLVVSVGATGGFEPEMVVAVTGTVHEAFELAAVEERFKTELEDELYGVWEGGPYLEAIVVDMG